MISSNCNLKGDATARVQVIDNAGWSLNKPLIAQKNAEYWDGGINQGDLGLQIYGTSTDLLTNVEISGFELTAGNQSASTGSWYYILMLFHLANNMDIHDMHLHNSYGDFIRILGNSWSISQNVNVHDNLMEYSGHDGLYFAGIDTLNAYNNEITHTRTNDGIRFEECKNVYIYNNIIGNDLNAVPSGYAGILLYNAGVFLTTAKIYNNYIYGKASSIVLEAGTTKNYQNGVHIHHNKIFKTLDNTAGIGSFLNGGIHIYGAHNTLIEFNTIEGSQKDGIIFEIGQGLETGYQTIVQNNIITNCDNFGINNLNNNHTFINNNNDVFNCTNGYYNNTSSNTDIHLDPLFETGISTNDPNLMDLHLKSEYGRWNGATWDIDNITSPCIDSGILSSNYDNELLPNGEIVNIGAFGNTIEASKSACLGVTVFTPAGWSNGIPNSTTQIVIDKSYQTAQEGNIDACSCKVQTGQTLQIEPNSYVKLAQDLVNNGTVEIMHQGSFVQVNNNATVTGSGTFTTHLQTTQLDDTSRFTYFSSPVQNQDLTVFNSWARMNRLWRFDEGAQDWYIVPSSTVMTPAVGFAIQGDVDTGQYPFIGYADFDGAFNNGIYSYPLTYNIDGIDDDNALVGNPYPSAINATLLLNNNPNANAFYFWTHKSIILPDGSAYAGDDYAIWNSSGGIASTSGSPAPTGFIASGQGFFVGATATGTITFNNSMRVTNNNTDFRKPVYINRDRIWVNLSNEDGYFNQILINFTENGTENFDAKLDAVRFNSGNAISFYSKGLNEETFAIQAVPNLSTDDRIPLGYEVNINTISNLKISIDHLEFQNDTNVYVKDNLLGLLHDLNQSDYQFIVTQGQFNDRFELVFNRSALSVNDNPVLKNEKLIVYNNNSDYLHVKTKSQSNITKLMVFDVLGKTIFSIENSKKEYKIYAPQIKQGTVLFIKAKLENGKTLNIKFLVHDKNTIH